MKDQEVIMIGEMHGTMEPSRFASGLCSLIADREDKVVLGMEIPPSQMKGYNKDMSLEQLLDLDFFAAENISGMNGEAWIQLLNESNQNDRIITKFIDTQEFERDSSMYLSILDIKRNYPNTKIVTLTGNIHNWIKPYKGTLKLGGYLMRDTMNFDKNKIMSINHIFNQGTMLNNLGDGLELTTIKPKENIFNKTIRSKNFLSMNIYSSQNAYSHFLYTEEVNHSSTIEKSSLVVD